MCGITGAVWTDPRLAISSDTLARMTDRLAHRGPDDRGFFVSELQLEPPSGAVPGVAFGHRRLSIIDRQSSRQPMANEDGSVVVVFNGEIYNYRELRLRLEASGHRFRSQGDTEVLVHLYEDEGVDFVRHLVGMFALAIWDRVIAAWCSPATAWARSRWCIAGAGPTAVRQRAQESARRAGRRARDRPRNARRVFAVRYVPHPHTIFRGIQQVAAGARRGAGRTTALTVRPYWQPDFTHEEPIPEAEYVDRLRCAIGRSRAIAAGERRAAGGVSLRRRRFVDHRCLDARARRRTDQDVYRRLSRSGIRRDGVRPPRGQST